MPRRRSWLGATFLSLCAVARAADSLGYLEQSFYFDYNIASQAVPVPVTTQCETIHLTWSRGAGTGPDPTAPYFLQIYTSAFVFPFVVDAGSGLSFDWQVPFGPGTIYQICMFDKNGNTGGCQATYTMIANTTSTPSCNNVTFPLGPLDVDAVVHTGPLSQYGWIDQCTDIEITPKNGTAPYIFTVAPALHPPHNVTSADRSAVNWTVNLSWGSPFFISVVDADMNFWAVGPLHSGQGTSGACLSGSKDSDSTTISPATAVASGIGGLLLGLLAGVTAAFVFVRQRRKRTRGTPLLDPTGSNGYNPYPYDSSPNATRYKALPSRHLQDGSMTPSLSPSHIAMQRMQTESSNYQIEPFTPPNERLSSYGAGDSTGEHRPASPSTSGQGNIYVVHHDAGRAPVTVYHQDGTEVVELPPRYMHTPNPSATPTDQRSVSGAAPSERRTSSPSVPELLEPPRRPNRPRKP
ncbi:hypothetical protein B0H16DRAFT_1488517 [Mycena metata]|uniref:Uncharacterized protein n=1 Tax=Mycena metata TaxID=1033252 RepID=A0AAD7KJ08_9AGAR|nr:hypothetical protein B0H16DRAFT_1488517 [Mycena metata]